MKIVFIRIAILQAIVAYITEKLCDNMIRTRRANGANFRGKRPLSYSVAKIIVGKFMRLTNA